MEDNTALMSEKLVNKSDLGCHRWTALHLAAYQGNLVTLIHLLSLPNIIIDTEDDEGWTPLHVACFYNNLEVIKVLLMKGASLTKKVNRGHLCATPRVPAEVFQEILDESIQFKEGSKHHIEFDYSFLQTLNPSKDSTIVDLESQNDSIEEHDRIALIHLIVNTSKKHWELLKHPVIENYLLQKWNKSKLVVSITVIFHLIMFCLLTVFIVQEHFPYITDSAGRHKKDCNPGFGGLRITLLCCISFQLLTHLINLAKDPVYFLRFMIRRPYISMNILVLICGLFLATSTSPTYCNIRCHISALLLPIACLDFLAHSLGIHPAISTSYLMFIRVQVTFVSNFIFYVPLLAAFGVSFGLVFGPSSDFSARRVFLKVVAMLIGEIDYGDIDTDSSDPFAFVCKLLLLLGFILAFSVTLMNLLNGLAVTDIRTELQKVAIAFLAGQISNPKSDNIQEKYFKRAQSHFLQLETREIHKKSALHSLHRLLGLFAMMKQVNGNVLARYKMCDQGNWVIAKVASFKIRMDRAGAR